MTVERTWVRIEAAVGAVDPDGLRPPAQPADLVELGVPEAWRGLWLRHDGQSPAVDGVFLGWFFLALRGPVDTVEAELEMVPDGFLPLAKDFAGGLIAADLATGAVQRLDDDGGVELVAEGLAAFLVRVADQLEEQPVRRWVKDGDRYVPAGRRVSTLSGLSEWAVGEARDLHDGLVLVRVQSPDPAPFVQHGLRLDLAIDHPENPDATGALVALRISVPTGPEGTGGGAPVSVCTTGDAHWIEAQGPIPSAATLEVETDIDRPLEGLRPLLHAREPEASVQRARARLLLGDLEGALSDLWATEADPAMLVEIALARHDQELAATAVERLPPGHPVRVRALAGLDPARALPDADRLVATNPDGVAYAWRALLHEALGHFAESVLDTERALAELGPAHAQEVASLRVALRRRRARVVAPRAEAPVLEDPTEDVVVPQLVPLEPEDGRWRARVVLHPLDAASGRLVEFAFPSGERGAVRLPPGAGHGVSATMMVGQASERVVVELALELPEEWRSDGDNPTLEFDRWDVIAPVPSPSGKVRVRTLDALHEVEWPKGAHEVRVEGGGLLRSDGSRGDLIARSAES